MKHRSTSASACPAALAQLALDTFKLGAPELFFGSPRLFLRFGTQCQSLPDISGARVNLGHQARVIGDVIGLAAGVLNRDALAHQPDPPFVFAHPSPRPALPDDPVTSPCLHVVLRARSDMACVCARTPAALPDKASR